MKKIIISLLGVITLLPSLALAETVVRTGTSVSVNVDQVVDGDMYAVGNTVSLSGSVDGDLYAAGGLITVNGPIESDLTLLSASAQVHSDVSDDVRVVAGDTVIANKVKGDVFVMGGSLKILSSASIGGNVYFYGEKAEIDGPVLGGVMGVMQSLEIDGSVGKSVDVTVGSLTLGDSAKVGGDMVYVSGNELSRSQNAVITGRTVRNAEATTESSKSFSWVPVLALGFAVFSLYLFFKDEMAALVGRLENRPIRFMIFGLVMVFAAPVAGVLLFSTMLGSVVGIAIILATLLLWLVAAAIVPAVIGVYLLKFIKSKKELDVMAIVVGLLAMILLLMIPTLGIFLLFVLFTYLVGAIAESIYGYLFT